MTLTTNQRIRLYKLYWKSGGPNYCYYCALYVSRKNRTLDHLTPKSRGGTAKKSNIVLACRTCNNAKADMTLAEFVDFVADNGGILKVKEDFGTGSHSRKKVVVL